MNLIIILLSCFNLHAMAQIDGSGHPGLVLRAYVKDGAGFQETMVLGTEHSRPMEATYPVTDVTNVAQFALKIAGKGIQARTQEVVAFACMGAQFEKASYSPSCDYLRALYYNPQSKKVYAFGEIYHAGNTHLEQFFKGLRETWRQEGGPRVVNNQFLAFYSDQLTNQDGWSWATSPERVPYRNFLSIVAEIQGAVLRFYTKTRGMIFSLMIQPEHPGIFSPWNLESGR